MPKSVSRYWNVFDAAEVGAWSVVRGLEGMAEELTLAHDPQTGHYTRLTRFLPGADTAAFGAKSHDYPEEVYVVSGELHDAAFGRLLRAGDYVSRPPGEAHGPFRSQTGCLVLEISCPNGVTDD